MSSLVPEDVGGHASVLLLLSDQRLEITPKGVPHLSVAHLSLPCCPQPLTAGARASGSNLTARASGQASSLGFGPA